MGIVQNPAENHDYTCFLAHLPRHRLITRNVYITKYAHLYKLSQYNGNDPKINRVLSLPLL
jgi:hypothetical protein